MDWLDDDEMMRQWEEVCEVRTEWATAWEHLGVLSALSSRHGVLLSPSSAKFSGLEFAWDGHLGANGDNGGCRPCAAFFWTWQVWSGRAPFVCPNAGAFSGGSGVWFLVDDSPKRHEIVLQQFMYMVL